MRRRWLLAGISLLAALVGACSFKAPALQEVPLDSGVDSAPDALPETCSAGQTACDGRNRLSCGANNQWVPQPCDFTCALGACVAPSNVPIANVMACGPTAPALKPPSGGSVTISGGAGGPRLTCNPDCGTAGVTTINATVVPVSSPNPDLAVFCFSSIDLAAGVSVGLPGTGGPAESLVFVVDGAVSIAGGISLDGKAATAATGGVGAPGGFDGASLSNNNSAGLPGGGGACGGGGGGFATANQSGAGGGGGGGGGGVAGRQGGNGRNPANTTTATGGGGGTQCGTATLTPLLGGAGGGGGGDATCGSDCGWPSGGGGGALQISARTSISVAGMLRARGGDGYGVTTGAQGAGGGGGGGAGGSLLLEAPLVTVAGTLNVDGGNGGPSAAGPGGTGAMGANGPTAGANFSTAAQGGSGGGASGGRIRINAPGAACPAGASPTAACTTGALTPQ